MGVRDLVHSIAALRPDCDGYDRTDIVHEEFCGPTDGIEDHFVEGALSIGRLEVFPGPGGCRHGIEAGRTAVAGAHPDDTTGHEHPGRTDAVGHARVDGPVTPTMPLCG